MNILVPDTVLEQVKKLVPAAIIQDIACFVFYDNHPRDDRNIDLTICTNGGKIVEYFKRQVVATLRLNCMTAPSDVRIVRNSNCDLFYIVVAGDELSIVSKKNGISVHRQVNNVEKYEIEDVACRGQACLKIHCKDDAVPMVFDHNLEHLGDRALVLSEIHADDSSLLLMDLMRKLTEAKFGVKSNQRTLKEFLRLRQLSALSYYKQISPNSKESVFQSKKMEVCSYISNIHILYFNLIIGFYWSRYLV
jgi:hypothetical protein